MRDLDLGMTIVESRPADMPGAAAGWGVLNAEHAVFINAIGLSLTATTAAKWLER
jgi:hypothetical protein